MKTRLLASVLLSLCLFAGACGDDDSDGDDDDGSGTAGSNAGSGGDGRAGSGGAGSNAGSGGAGSGDGMGGERMIEIVSTEFAFAPNTITASPGDTLIISLRNAGAVDHNIEFEIGDDEFVLANDIGPDETADLTVEIPDDAEGDYDFYCPIGDHRALGMEGTLTVQ